MLILVFVFVFLFPPSLLPVPRLHHQRQSDAHGQHGTHPALDYVTWRKAHNLTISALFLVRRATTTTGRTSRR